MSRLVDLTGQTFGIWEVLEQAPRRDNKTRWLVRCTRCRAERSMRSTSLRSGQYAACTGTHKFRAGVPSPLRKDPGRAAGTEVFGHYRASARKRGLAFELDREDFDRLTAQPCHYCGAPPANRHTRRHFHGAFVYSGIDRKDSALGYVEDNCLPCCAVCNVMKQDLPYDAFVAHVHRIALRLVPADPEADARMALGYGGNTRPANVEG